MKICSGNAGCIPIRWYGLTRPMKHCTDTRHYTDTFTLVIIWESKSNWM